MAPPNSYIHVEDFNTPHKLVQYLDYLDKNEMAYAQYHQWRAMKPDFSSPIRSGTGKEISNINHSFSTKDGNIFQI